MTTNTSTRADPLERTAIRVAAETVVKLVDAGLLGAHLDTFEHIAGIVGIPVTALTRTYKRQLDKHPVLAEQRPANRERFSEKNPSPGYRVCSRCAEVKHVSLFNVKNKVTGNRMPWCKLCGKIISRQRYVAAKEAGIMTAVRMTLRDGSPFVGDACPNCTNPLEVGQRICGSDVVVRHVNCKTANASLKLLSIAKQLRG